MSFEKIAVSLAITAIVAAFANADEPQPIRLILDTDMTDVDDVGTVAVLHALADQEEVEILAMGFSGKNASCPSCLNALNTYFYRPDVPIGVAKWLAFDKRSRFAETIAKEFPHSLKSADDASDAAVLYRKVLAGQPDKSVVMVSVGQVTNFKNLLTTGPDEHSDLNGIELVKRKVKAWVCMGGTGVVRSGGTRAGGGLAGYPIVAVAVPNCGGVIGQGLWQRCRLRRRLQIGDNSPQDGRLTSVVRDVFKLLQNDFSNRVRFVAKPPRFIPRLLANRRQECLAMLPYVVEVL